MNRDKAIELLNEFASGNLNAEDEKTLQEWIAQASQADIQEVMQKYEAIVMKMDKGVPDPVLFQKIRDRIAAEEAHEKEERGAKVYPVNGHRPKVKKFSWSNVAAAVVIVCILGAAAYYISNKPQKLAQTQTQKYHNDIAPGGNKAILTLANGRQIVLDSAANGTLANQGNIKIIKLDSGQLAYNGSQIGDKEIPDEIAYNTISTPRGGQYQLTLSDGTKVWLNAASSLRFPASFFGKERNVELTGEGYFEVVHNSAQPFTVGVNGIEVHDIGTAFNINAYTDEPSIKTTLISGSVKVTELKSQNSKLLKPGQQAVVKLGGEEGQSSERITVSPADVNEAIAWKNGKFQFGEGADIASIMRQIARWYDVDVEYKGNVTGHIGGSISRNVNVSKVFDMLEMTGGVKFKIEGKKVIVMP